MSVSMMPLPGANRHEGRVYALSKGQSLADIAGNESWMATLGDPIAVQNLNEDELRRLVLLKLAVESVRGDWVGLLS
jgi:hypothetical protein